MKLAHNVHIRVLEKEKTFNLDQTTDLFKKILPDDFSDISDKNFCKKNKIEFKVEEIKSKDALKVSDSQAKIVDGDDLVRFELIVSKDKYINSFIQYLKSIIPEKQREEIKSQENRVDEDCNFYIRLKKEDLSLTQSGDCIHIKIKLAAYPNKKTNALKLVQEIF